jgi:N-acetylglucosaminyl-diphospho-decaprenol L-rhamnosyltransferase
MAGPNVDVGIVTHGARDVAVAAIGRLLDVAGDLRVLVHDNASPDGTAEAIATSHPSVDLQRSPVNLGFAAGMNRVLARSTAPWLLALNPDAWPEPGAVERLVTAGEAHPRVAAVAPMLLRPDGRLEHSTQPLPSLRVAASCAAGGYDRLVRRDRPGDVGWAVGAALLLRRRAVEDVGGFDERLFLFAEDLEWCWRARDRGWTIRFEPEAVVRHIGGASASVTYGRRRTRAHVHNTYRVFRERRGALATLAYRALNVVGCARLYLLARLRRDAEGRAEWADHLRAHLAPVRGADAPPER